MRKNKSNRKLKIAIVINIILIFIVSSLLIINNLSKDTSSKNNNDNIDKVNKNELAVKINAVLNFEDDISNNPGIENPINNNYDVIVKIYLENNNEEICTTKKLSPGEKIDTIKLNKKLDSGRYKAIAFFNAYDSKNDYRGKSGVEINLNVE